MKPLRWIVCLLITLHAAGDNDAFSQSGARRNPALQLSLDAPSFPTEWQELKLELERRVALELVAARRTAEAERQFQEGLLVKKTGRIADAEQHFSAAESVILDAGEEAYELLRDYLHRLRAKITIETASSSRTQQKSPPMEEPDRVAVQTSIDRRTMAWLASAFSRPVPEESKLRRIFRSHGVPEELIYIGLVESGYRNQAVSPAGAVGPWQFMDGTGGRYGLARGRGYDERNDLLKSTRAAARYLRDLYELLGDWTLAVAGYNAGEYRILKAVQQSRTKDFWSLRHLLPQETAQYVPKVLAAIRIARGRPMAIPDAEVAVGSESNEDQNSLLLIHGQED